MRGFGRVAFAGAVAGLLFTGPQAGAGGGVIMCFSYEHVPFRGAPSSISFGAFLRDFDPGTDLSVTIAFGDFEGSAPRTVDPDRILFGKVPIAEFGEYRVRVTTIEPPDEVVYGGSIVVEPGPFEGEPCSRGRLRDLAAAAGEPEPAPDLAPDEEPPVAAPPGADPSGEFPWVWVIVGGGAGAAGGALLLATSRKPAVAGAEATAVSEAVVGLARPSTPRQSSRSGAVLTVHLSIEPPATLEDPVEPGTELRARITVINEGDREARNPAVAILRFEWKEEGDESASRRLGPSLAPGASVTEEIAGKARAGRPSTPGLSRLEFAAEASAENSAPARSERVTVHVAHPVLVVTLSADPPSGPVREGAEIRYQVRIQNVGRATAEDVKGRLTAEGSSPDGKSKDSWERSFESDDLDPGMAHEEEFVIVPSALGDVATLRATASVEADGVVPAESDPVELTINRL